MTYLGTVPCLERESAPKKGITIGKQDADYNVGSAAEFQAAIAAIESAGGTKKITMVNGTIRLESNLVFTADDMELCLDGAATLVVQNSGAIGAIAATGARFKLKGSGLIYAPLSTNDQVIVSTSGFSSSVHGIRIDHGVAGSSSNPVTSIKATGDRFRSVGVEVHPNDGVRMVWLNEVRKARVEGLRAITPPGDVSNRLFWYGVHVDGGQANTVTRCDFDQVGTAADPGIGIYAIETDDLAGQSGDRYTDNTFHKVGTRSVIKLQARKGVSILNNRFFACVGITENNYVDRFDATILLDNLDGGISAANLEYSAHTFITGNEFDANAVDTASEIYIKSGAKTEVTNNRFPHFSGRYVLTVDADHTQNWSANGNTLDGFYPTNTLQELPIRVLNRLTEDEAGETVGSTATPLFEHCEAITIQNNRTEGFRFAFPVLQGGLGTFPPCLGVRGGYYPFGLDSWQEIISATTISFTAPATIADSGNGFGNLRPGDYMMILGSNDPENNGLRPCSAAAAGSLTMVNPSDANNPDPTRTETALVSGGYGALSYSGNVITRTVGSWITDGFGVGLWFALTSAKTSDNNGQNFITAITATTVTIGNRTFETDSGDTTASPQLRGKGYTLKTRAAGDTIKIYVYRRSSETLGVTQSFPINTNLAMQVDLPQV